MAEMVSSVLGVKAWSPKHGVHQLWGGFMTSGGLLESVLTVKVFSPSDYIVSTGVCGQ